jgi:tripartite-type tricarboxylate transporter receptor subunit TctC
MRRFRCVTRRPLLAVVMLALLAGGPARADSYPSQTVRIVVPFAAGGLNDTVARLIAPHLEKALGKSVIIDNRPGAAGSVGTMAVTSAAADGHTLLMIASSHTVAEATNPNLPFDSERDLASVGMVSRNPMLFVSSAKVAARTLPEFVALAKSKSGELNYATVGHASQSHLITELFGQRAGIKMLHVPYRGGAPAVTSLITGETQFAVLSPQVTLAQIEAGTLRALAIGSPQRDPKFPDLPTIAEQGFPSFEAIQWVGLLAPAKTPKAVIERLNAEISKALKSPDLVAKLAQQGMEPAGGAPEDFQKVISAEIKVWTEVAKAANIKTE